MRVSICWSDDDMVFNDDDMLSKRLSIFAVDMSLLLHMFVRCVYTLRQQCS